MLEIERKFKVIGDEWRQGIHRTSHILQGYFPSIESSSNLPPSASVDAEKSSIGMVVRIRKEDVEAFLTIKSKTLIDRFTRYEFEYSIPLNDAEQMIELFCAGRTIEKKRHYLSINDDLWVIDEFVDHNQGLVLAEIELDAEDSPFIKPPWLGEEVTHDPAYLNCNLIHSPL